MQFIPEEARVLEALEESIGNTETTLAEFRGFDTSARNKAGVDAFGRRLEEHLLELGFATSFVISGTHGSHLLARTRGKEGNRLLLIGHVDTGDLPSGLRDEGPSMTAAPGRIVHPGVANMKGGLAMLVSVLRTLRQAFDLHERRLTIILTGDETLLSPTSGDFLEAEAGDHDLCLALGPGSAKEDGATTIVTARSGGGRIRFRPRTDEAVGASDLSPDVAKELADLERESSPDEGTSVRGRIVGTGKGQEVEIGYCFADSDSGADLADRLKARALRLAGRSFVPGPGTITPLVDHVTVEPMPRSDAVARMSARIIDAAGDLGLRIEEELRSEPGGANFAAPGCPTLDGLGVAGGAFGTSAEWILRQSLADRAQLLCLTILRFFRL